MYGFTKIRSENDQSEYKNPYFIRGSTDKIKKIERKINNLANDQGSGR